MLKRFLDWRILDWIRSLWNDDLARMLFIDSVLGRVIRNNPAKREKLQAWISSARDLELLLYTKEQMINKLVSKADPLDQAVVSALMNQVLKDWKGDAVKLTGPDAEMVMKILDQISQVIS